MLTILPLFLLCVVHFSTLHISLTLSSPSHLVRAESLFSSSSPLVQETKGKFPSVATSFSAYFGKFLLEYWNIELVQTVNHLPPSGIDFCIEMIEVCWLILLNSIFWLISRTWGGLIPLINLVKIVFFLQLIIGACWLVVTSTNTWALLRLSKSLKMINE